MTREGSPDAGRHGRRDRRPWAVLGVVLAVVATTVVVISDDPRWLRLAVVSALWAALLGAFVAAHYRRTADQTGESMTEAQRIYELELEREVAARREYELELDVKVRADAGQRSRAEVDALRKELAVLRATLQQLFGAEVLYERVALTAQSTRMRSLGERDAPPPRRYSALSAAQARRDHSPRDYRDQLAEQRTELITRVLGPERRPSEPAGPRAEADDAGFSLFSPPPPPQPPQPPQPRSPLTPSRGEDAASVTRTDPAGDAGSPARGSGAGWTPSWDRAGEPDGGREVIEFPRETAPAGTAPEPEPEPVNLTLPPRAVEIQHSGQPGGRWRKPDPEQVEPLAATGGRHARAVAPEPEPVPEPVETGSHTAGRPVNDLLAAYGSAGEPRRRRRRA